MKPSADEYTVNLQPCPARLLWPFLELYSRSPKNPTLQLFQKSSKSASTTPQRTIWNTFGTLAVRDFWESGCTVVKWFRRHQGQMSRGVIIIIPRLG